MGFGFRAGNLLTLPLAKASTSGSVARLSATGSLRIQLGGSFDLWFGVHMMMYIIYNNIRNAGCTGLRVEVRGMLSERDVGEHSPI